MTIINKVSGEQVYDMEQKKYISENSKWPSIAPAAPARKPL
jgi:hypothetical protein